MNNSDTFVEVSFGAQYIVQAYLEKYKSFILFSFFRYI